MFGGVKDGRLDNYLCCAHSSGLVLKGKRKIREDLPGNVKIFSRCVHARAHTLPFRQFRDLHSPIRESERHRRKPEVRRRRRGASVRLGEKPVGEKKKQGERGLKVVGKSEKMGRRPGENTGAPLGERSTTRGATCAF